MTTANNPVVTAEMLPCPFCGGGNAKPDYNGEGDFDVTCLDCHAGCIGVGPGKDGIESAIAAWNTRAMTQASPPPDEMVERLTLAIVAAIKADCTKWNGECYAVGDRDAMEVYGEFDPEAIARAALQSIGPMRGVDEVSAAIEKEIAEAEAVIERTTNHNVAAVQQGRIEAAEAIRAALKSIEIEDQG